MVRLLDEPDQLIGHDAAAHLAALFHAVAHAAIKGKAVRGHLSGLIAAAALRHIQRLHGHILGFPQGLGPAPDANGDGQVHAGVQSTDLIQHIVAALGILLQMALFHHGDIAAAGNAAQKACAPADHILQHPVDAFQQAGALTVQHIAEHIVVAVHQEHHVTRAAGLVLRFDPAQGGLLIEHEQRHALAAARHGTAVHIPHTVGQIELLPLRGAGLGGVQAGQQLLCPACKPVLAAQQRRAEPGVIPQHCLARKQSCRLRKGFQAVLGPGIFKAAASHPLGGPAPQLIPENADADAPQHRQHRQRRPACRPLHQKRQCQQCTQHCQRGDQHFQRPSRFLFHGIFCLLVCLPRRGGFRLIPPSEWGGSSGCAWCGGRYSCSAPHAPGS